MAIYPRRRHDGAADRLHGLSSHSAIAYPYLADLNLGGEYGKNVVPSVVAAFGFTMAPTCIAVGSRSRSNPNRFAPSSLMK
jgi:hypothetical protein